MKECTESGTIGGTQGRVSESAVRESAATGRVSRWPLATRTYALCVDEVAGRDVEKDIIT